MYTIKTLNKIAEQGLRQLGEGYQLIGEETEGDYEGVILRSFKMHDYVISNKLTAVARAGAGVNNVPVEEYASKGIVVFNTPGANANAVKELAIAALLLSSRDIPKAIDWAKTLKGQEDVAKKVEAGKSQFVGPEIAGKTLGVIGLGAIGAMVANTALALGMEVYGYDPFISVDGAWELNSDIHKANTLDELAEKADYVTVHVPLLEQTKGMIDAEFIEKAKDHVRIINLARGGLVDNTAIKKGLESGKVCRYVTDFPDDETIGMEGVIAIPHLGASTPESEINCAVMASKQIKDYLENGNIINSVNYPTTDLGKCTSEGRVAILHKNVPNMVGQITAVLAEENINIENMVNRSKKDFAYTLIDAGSAIGENIVTSLSSIEGVLKVRVIK